MIDLARANDIAVVLAGIPPSRKFSWRPDLDPRPQIAQLNAWLRNVAFNNGYVWVDYSTVLADADGGLRANGRYGLSVLEISRLNDVPHAHVCSGRGRCGTCRVRINVAANGDYDAGKLVVFTTVRR